MHICKYRDRLETIGGELVRIVTASATRRGYEYLKQDVYREYESGKTESRHLYISMYGYRVAFPGESVSLYSGGYYPYTEEEEDFAECGKINAFYSRKLKEEEKALIAGKYPDFCYVLKKWNGSIEKTLDALAIWKEHKEIEFILAAGWEDIALNKSFWRLTEKMRKSVVMYRKHHDNVSVSDILVILRYNLSYDEFMKYRDFCRWQNRINYPAYKYLLKIGKADWQGVRLYRDYLNMLKQTDHGKSDYWLYPKNLQKKHNELCAEIERKKELEELEKLQKKQKDYTKAVKRYIGKRLDAGGYSVYIPETVKEIRTHAKVLHQCLVSADYIGKVIDGKCYLVFVVSGGKPIATAEVFKSGKIGQFYTDELDRNNCLPSAEVRGYVTEWITNNLKKKAA